MSTDRNLRVSPEAPTASRLDMLRVEENPSQDLWPEIQARLTATVQARRARSLTVWRAAAGFAAIVFGLGFVANRMIASDHAPPLVSPPDFAASNFPHDNPALISAGAQTAETRALVKVNLKIVNDARSQIERALGTDPKNASLQNLLLTTRDQQHELRQALAPVAAGQTAVLR